MNAQPETPYTETEVLLAVINNDLDHAKELLAGMYRAEVSDFLSAINALQGLAQDRWRDVRRQGGAS